MAGRRKSAVETLLAVQRQQSTHLQDIYREPSGGDTDGVSTGGATLYSRLESPKRETRDDLFGAGTTMIQDDKETSDAVPGRCRSEFESHERTIHIDSQMK